MIIIANLKHVPKNKNYMPNAHPHTQILIEKNFIVIFQNLDFSFLLKLKACLTLDTKMECLPSGPAL